MLSVLRRHAEFRRLWSAQAISQAGDWFNRIAILALIGRLSGPGGAAGLGALYAIELAVRLLPAAALGPIAGPVADRVPRRLLMITADLSRAGVVLAMTLVREPEHLKWLYLLLTAQMGLAVFFESAKSASLPNTVGRDDLHAAYALSAATWSTMLTAGTLASAALIRVLGIRGMLVTDAATYLASAAILSRLRLPPPPEQQERFSWRDVLTLVDLRRGAHHVRAVGAGAGLWAKAFWGPAGAFLVMLSVAGRERFAGSETDAAALAAAAGSATAILLAGRGLGTGLGPVLSRQLFGSRDRVLLRVVLGGFFVAATGYALFAAAPNLLVASACVLFAHLGGGALWVASTTFWQKHVEDTYRGRVSALEILSMTVGFSLGGVLGGALYDRTHSVAVTTWILCALVATSGILWGAIFLRRAVPEDGQPTVVTEPRPTPL